MKKKLFLIAFAIIPLTACTISFTNNPGGSIFTSSSSSSSGSSSEVNYIESVVVPDQLSSYTITFNSNHTITQPEFETAEEIFNAIEVKDSGEVIEQVTNFENVSYGPSCLVIKSLSLKIKKTFPFSYVGINATPFYAKSYDHLNQKYIFVTSSGALNLNNSGYIRLNETNNGLEMNTTTCNFASSDETLTISALDERVFINSITLYY